MNSARWLKIHRTDIILYDFFYHAHYSIILILKFSAVCYLQPSLRQKDPRLSVPFNSRSNGRVVVSEIHISGVHI